MTGVICVALLHGLPSVGSASFALAGVVTFAGVASAGVLWHFLALAGVADAGVSLSVSEGSSCATF